MSRAGGSEAGGSGDVVVSVDDTIVAIHAAIGHANELSVSQHGSVVRKLARVRSAMTEGGDMPSQRGQMLLMCTGIAVQRRILLMVGEDANENSTDLYRTTLLLLFVLVALCGQSGDVIAAEALVERAATASLWNHLREAGTFPSSGEVASATLALAVDALPTASAEEIGDLSNRFFRSSAAAMTEDRLKALGDGSFLSLSSSRFVGSVSDRSDRLETLVSAAESESGQSVIRDLMLSFLLPARVIGTRRTLLLTREAAAEATVEYAEDVQRAHETAMAGANLVWNEESDADDWELRKISSLLAGIACATTRGGEDPIRKAVAFAGRVQLPFLETPLPSQGKRLVLVPGSGSWILLKIERSGNPTVLTSAEGLEGLKLGCLGLMDD